MLHDLIGCSFIFSRGSDTSIIIHCCMVFPVTVSSGSLDSAASDDFFFLNFALIHFFRKHFGFHQCLKAFIYCNIKCALPKSQGQEILFFFSKF